MEVSPTGAAPSVVSPQITDPVALLHIMVNLQSQTLELMRQMADMQRQQLEFARENTHVARDQRSRQTAELEKWQQAHEPMIDTAKDALSRLENVHAALLKELTEYAEENHDNLLDGDFSLSDFVDRYGPKLAHVNTMLAVLRPLAAATKKAEAPPAT
jgi:hypothetical protein